MKTHYILISDSRPEKKTSEDVCFISRKLKLTFSFLLFLITFILA